MVTEDKKKQNYIKTASELVLNQWKDEDKQYIDELRQLTLSFSVFERETKEKGKKSIDICMIQV